MTDPVTIGTLAASALAMAAEAVLKGAVGEGVKDAYKALKEKVAHWAGSDVEELEKAPASANRKALIAEAVDRQPVDERAMVKTLAAVLVLSVQLDAITVTVGTGVRIDEVTTQGEFRAGPINVGPPPGKTDR
jgi:hypothetical protein